MKKLLKMQLHYPIGFPLLYITTTNLLSEPIVAKTIYSLISAPNARPQLVGGHADFALRKRINYSHLDRDSV
jgi:hypothetical protein